MYIEGQWIYKKEIKDLESGSLSFAIAEKFLTDLNKEFRGENNKTMKMAELKKVEQEGKMIE